MVDIAATLVSNSTQLDNVDLMGGARVFTITNVTVNESAEQPMTVTLAEYPRPWKPGLTMRRLMAHIWDSTESDDYIGKRVRLHRDEKVSFGTTKTGGTRISHASHLEKRTTVTLPTSKGKFGEFTVEPLVESASPAYDIAATAAKAVAHFAEKFGKDQAFLEDRVGKPIAEWSPDDLAELKAYADQGLGALPQSGADVDPNAGVA